MANNTSAIPEELLDDMMKIVESDPEDAGDTLRLCRLVSRQFERIAHVKRAFRVVRLGCYHKKTHHQQCHDCFNPYKRFLRNDENTHIFTQVQELRFTSGCLNRGINEVKLHCEVLLNLLQPLSALKTLHLQDVILSLGTKQEWPWKPATASPWHRKLEQNIQQLIPKFSRFIILDSKLVLTEPDTPRLPSYLTTRTPPVSTLYRALLQCESLQELIIRRCVVDSEVADSLGCNLTVPYLRVDEITGRIVQLIYSASRLRKLELWRMGNPDFQWDYDVVIQRNAKTLECLALQFDVIDDMGEGMYLSSQIPVHAVLNCCVERMVAWSPLTAWDCEQLKRVVLGLRFVDLHDPYQHNTVYFDGPTHYCFFLSLLTMDLSTSVESLHIVFEFDPHPDVRPFPYFQSIYRSIRWKKIGKRLRPLPLLKEVVIEAIVADAEVFWDAADEEEDVRLVIADWLALNDGEPGTGATISFISLHNLTIQVPQVPPSLLVGLQPLNIFSSFSQNLCRAV